MKKVLALVLAFTLVFSSISFVFADEEVAVSDEGAALVTLGMLSGADGGYTAEYEAEELTRLQAAAAILKLKGLYEDAIAFDGVDNFADVADYAWVEGRNLMAYMKANPELGFIGDGVNFNPGAKIDEQSYYKVLLETLGYKQNVGEVVGDFAWEETLEFAEKVGLKPAGAEKFTVGDLAKATVAALKAETKDGKVYIDALIEAGKVTEEKAVVAGFKDEAPVLVEVAVKEVKALGNTVVQVEFKEAVGVEAENLDNYEIAGLEIKGVMLTGEKLVQLETVAQTAGKVYKLAIGEGSYQFAGVAKDSGAPAIDKVEGKDVEEVVVTFKNDKKIDYVSGSDVDNYSIAGVEIVDAEVDGNEVTLTTEGLKNKTDYTLKIMNIKSIDGALKKSDTKKFRTSYDLVAPKLAGITVKTNQRLVLTFNEEVAQDTAEDIDNYEIIMDKTDDVLEITDITWDDDDKDNVTIITEPMEKGKKYKLTVNNIADTRKVANVMTRALSDTFTGAAEDKDAPYPDRADVQSPTTILVTFKDKSSDIDEDTVLDLNNYSSKNLDIEGIEVVLNDEKVIKALITVDEMKTGDSYELTIDNIADEFGNVMKSEKTIKNIKAGASGYASAKLDSQVATGKNTIVLTFNKELNKSTAENIANYNVNTGIGAPKKAKLDDEMKVVTLTVNDLTQGYGYKITIDGVEDLVGNELYYKDKQIVMAPKDGKDWDTVGPELEDVSVVNKYVVALTFDERVDKAVALTSTLTLRGTEDEGKNWTVLSPMSAKDVIEDGTVVEYSTYNSVYLNPDVTYEVYIVPVIKNYAGYSLQSFAPEDFRFYGEDEVDGIGMDKYEQTNGKTFKVFMDREVTVQTTITASVYDGDTYKGTVTFDADNSKDADIVFLKLATTGKQIEEDFEYVFEFSKHWTDRHKIPVAEEDDDVTVLTGEYTDEYAPDIEDVVAKTRKVVEVVFDEDIVEDKTVPLYSGFFKIKNLDVEDKYSEVGINKVTASGKKITIELSKALEARYEYELTFVKSTPVKEISDIVGKVLKGDNQTYYFYGTNLAD